MQRLLIAVGLLGLLLLPSATAQQQGLVEVVEAGDADVRTLFETTSISIGFVDADRFGTLTVDDPDEPVYIDLDKSRTVSVGDIRLTPFLNYPAASAVNFTNRDFDKSLTEIAGWFAHDGAGGWYVDTDASGHVNPGDIRLLTDLDRPKVRSGAPDVDTLLTAVQSRTRAEDRIGWVDEDGDRRLDHHERFYVDLQANGQVSEGDLRLGPAQISPEQPVFRDDLDRSVEELQAQITELEQHLETLRAELSEDDEAFQTRLDAQAAQTDQLASSVDAWNKGLLALGLLDLILVAGVIVVLWREQG